MLKLCCQCRLSKEPSHYYKGDNYCKPCRKARSEAYYKKKRAIILDRHAEYSLKNADKRRKTASEWAKANRHKRAEIWAAYYTSKINSMPKWIDREEIKAVYQKAKIISDETGILHHVDHIVPLQGANVCGLHVPWNLQVITALENARKSNKFAS